MPTARIGGPAAAPTAAVSPVKHAGPCPFRFNFKGTITYGGAQKNQKVQYKWVRDDGAFAPIQTLVFAVPGTKDVAPTYWQLSAEGHHWEAVEIVYPTSLQSDKAEFDLTCLKVVAPIERRVPPLKPMPVIREDCISFDPQTVKAADVQGRWKVVEGPTGSHLMFDFGANRAGAELAAKIIQHYGANTSCFVGRPNPSFAYLLANGGSPVGPYPGEDCLGFNPVTFEVKLVGTSWKIVDGAHWMFDFGSNETEAWTAFAIIKKYGFTRSCFFARGDPALHYMRK